MLLTAQVETASSMSEFIKVEAVASKQQQQEFLQLPWFLYEEDPNWIPPLLSNIKELLNYKPHPFYQKSQIQTFLARRDGKVVGRIAAIVDGFHNEYHKERRGMFGFFESINSQEVANALFNAAVDWFRQRGIQQIRGPANPSQNYEWGLLIDGFHSPPKFMMTYNKSYYQSLIESYGFSKSQDMFAYIGTIDMLDQLDPRLLFVAEEAKKRFRVNVRPVDKRNFGRDVDSFLKVYNAALPGQWGFTPMSPGELKASAAGLKHLIVPEMTMLAEVDGKVVGAVFGLLDYNPLIREIKGRLFPMGFLKLLWKRKQIQCIRMISTNVLPEYQKWGLGLVLLNSLVPSVRKWGIKEAEFSWVLESNRLSRGSLERGGAIRDKTYRIYDLNTET